MTVLVTGANANSPTYAPVNGELASAEDLLNSAIQPIENKLEWLRQRIPGLQPSRTIPLNINGHARSSSWSMSCLTKPYMIGQVESLNSSKDYELWIPLHEILPQACRISAFGCRVMANPEHGSTMPEILPRLSVEAVDRLGGPTSGPYGGAEIYDSSADMDSYKLMHSIQLSLPGGGFLTTFAVNTLECEYWLHLRNEHGANSAPGLRLYHAWITIIPAS